MRQSLAWGVPLGLKDVPKYRLVVDANVARSANEQGLENAAAAVVSRRTLEAVRGAGHRIAMGDRLLVEWQKHESKFAKTWRVEMERRGKIVRLDDAPAPHWDTCFSQLVADQSFEAQNIWSKVKKDLHLAQAATETDKRIVSGDNNMRGHLSNHGQSADNLMEIIWVNPQEAGSVDWISAGCPDEERRKLANYVPGENG